MNKLIPLTKREREFCKAFKIKSFNRLDAILYIVETFLALEKVSKKTVINLRKKLDRIRNFQLDPDNPFESLAKLIPHKKLQRVFLMRYEKGLTYEKIGKALRVTRQRIERLIRDAEAYLRCDTVGAQIVQAIHCQGDDKYKERLEVLYERLFGKKTKWKKRAFSVAKNKVKKITLSKVF